MMEAILNIQNLYKHYDGIVAVDNVSLSIMQGTITGIFGDNGAGKTTLFNLLSGFENPDSGSVYFDGKDITKKSVIYRARHGMGRLFQIPRFFGDITVLDNLMAAGNNHEAKYLHNYLLKHTTIKKNIIKDSEKAINILEQFHLRQKASVKAYELSVGEKKLLSLGCLLMSNKKLILLDELTSGINSKMIDELSAVLVALHSFLRYQSFPAIIMIEHNNKILNDICQKVYKMENGKLLS